MAVTFTSNIGLAKPTESELAKNWATLTELADDNNVIITDQMDIVMTTFTSSFIGATTNPNVGVGYIKGEFCKVNKTNFGSFSILFTDPGVSAGSGVGAYGISLPELADNVFHNIGTSLADTPGTASCVGEGYLTDNSSIALSGTLAFDIVRVGGIDYLRPITEAYAGKTNRWVGPSFPAAFATGDSLTGNFVYKTAT